jgi:hypothetical protein
MARTVYLHIGTHKTGTSSIQTAFNGFSNPHIRYASLGAPNHSLALHTLFAQHPERHHLHVNNQRGAAEVDVFRKTVARNLERELAVDGDLILSGEDLCELKRDEVQELAAYFASRSARVRVIAYYRDPLGFSASSLQQRVKAGLDEFCLIQPEYRRRIEHYVEVFGRENCDLRRFDRRAFPEGSVVRDFAGHLGIDSGAVAAVSTNTSMSAQAVSCLLYMNRSLGIPRESEVFFDLRRRFVDWLIPQLSGEKFTLPEALFAAAMDSEDIRWMESLTQDTLMQTTSDSPELAAKRKSFADDLQSLADREKRLLRDIAETCGLTLWAQEPPWRILNRLFLHFVERRTLGGNHADVLRDVALKIIRQESPSNADALALLRLAQTLRPEGPQIIELIKSLSDSNTVGS